MSNWLKEFLWTVVLISLMLTILAGALITASKP